MDDKFSIKLQIAGRYYPLVVRRDEEEKLRKAAKLINEKVNQYKQRYIEKEEQDFLAMVALQYVLKLIDFEKKADLAPLLNDLEEINDDLRAFNQTE